MTHSDGTAEPADPGVNPPAVEFVSDDAALRALVAAACGQRRYALDTEFQGERSYHPQLALVQVAFPGKIALVDPLACDVKLLRPLLESEAMLVAHAGDQDLAILQRLAGSGPRRYLDTQIAAGFCGLGVPSLANLAERLLSVKLPKGDRLTDWTRRPLSDDQCSYAADDVAHLLTIAELLEERLAASGRLDWALDECEERRLRDRARPDPETAWWRIKGGRQLRGKSRGVAQCVTAWRERRAEALDTPARYVLSELALAGIVARPPVTREQLSDIRGVDGRILREPVLGELLAAIQRGLALDQSELRLPEREETDRSLAPAVSVVAAWLSQRAGEFNLEPALLATRADLVELLNSGGGRLARGWRAELVGGPIRRLMEGKAVLALGDRGRRLELRDE
jgi:ribonuclease D